MATCWFGRKKGKKPPPPTEKPPTARVPAVVPGAAVGAKGVSVGKLLAEDVVLIDPAASTKDELMDILIQRLCRVKALGDHAAFFQKVVEREQGISTTLDTGLSLPHARIEGIGEIAAILGVVRKGLPDPKQPELSIRAMFLFFSPNKPEMFTRHLHLLRSVSTLFQPAFIDELTAVASASEALDLIRRKEG